MSDTNGYYFKNGQQNGPVPKEQIDAMIAKGELGPHEMVFFPPSTEWVPVAAYQSKNSPSAGKPAVGGPPSLPAQSRCGLATWAMVCGILGLLICFPAILAIVLGHVALSKIKQSGNTLTGHGQAVAGLVMGYLTILLIPIFGLLAAIAVPSFIRARQRALATTVLNECRMVDAAIDQYALEQNKKGENPVSWNDITPYLKAGSKLQQNNGSDAIGNPFRISGVINDGVHVSPESKDALSDATGGDAFWGPYS